MSLDDPRITAFALNELPTSERAEIERLLQTERATSGEVEKTREVAGILRNTLHAQPAEELSPRHREAIFRAALGVTKKADTERKIITHPALWQRAGFWQAAAACVVCGFGVYAITAQLYGPAQSTRGNIAASTSNEISVQIGTASHAVTDTHSSAPDIVSPANAQPAERHTLIAKIDAARTQRINVAPPTGTEPTEPDAKLRGIPGLPPSVAVAPTPEADPIAEIRRRASIGKKPASTNTDRTLIAPQLTATKPAQPITLSADLGSVTLTSEEAATFSTTRDYIQARWKEASSLHAGDSYETLARHFRHDGGITSGKSHRFVMIRCPLIKVDVEFAGGDQQKTGRPLDTRIEKISRPYLEPEAID